MSEEWGCKMKMAKKTESQIRAALPKFQKVLSDAKKQDFNESNTVDIITDILSEVFGYEKYSEITREYAIRGTYCDLAIKLDNGRKGFNVEYLIECKSVGTELRESHLRQAIDYGAKEGVRWLILTNGIDWQIYRLNSGLPITWDRVSQFNILQLSAKNERDLEQLFIVTKEGVLKSAREEVCEKARCVNRFVIAALLTSDMFVSTLKRELRKIGDGISIEDTEIASILRGEVLRSNLFDCEEAKSASSIVARHFKSAMRKNRKDKTNHDSATCCESKSIDGVPLISQSDAKISNGVPLEE